jgi:molybdopterin-containing oxidoreductase family iron-sulfur binding subunit
MQKEPIDLVQIRARLAGASGKQYWRSLEELAGTREFTEFLQREFPKGASELNEPLSRRSFLKFMAASLALAGLGGCAQAPHEPIVPYVQQPDAAIIPGRPLYFASAMPFRGYGAGVLVESHEGRPTKVEGNPDHPASLGATDAFAQASLLTLYDPDRAQAVTNLGLPSTWDAFLAALGSQLGRLQAAQGAGLRILTETVTSPTLGAQLTALLEQLPQARWHQYDPVGFDNARAGAQQAFGRYVNTVYNFAQADRILALDANFLFAMPGHLRYAREFIDRRRVSAGAQEMNRLYVVECTPTISGAMADHRLRVRPSEVEAVARAIAQGLGVAGQGAGAAAPANAEQWVAAVVRDLQASPGASIVLAGDEQPPAVHALAHAMNQALGNVGATVTYIDPVEVNPQAQVQSLRELAADMASGQVDTLVIVESNPVLTAPADLTFADALRQVPFSAHMSLYYDETSALCQWHANQAHYLESWGDVRAFNGTASIIQPLIAPLYGGKSAYELLAAMAGNTGQTGYDIVRAYWQEQMGAAPQPDATPEPGAAQDGAFEQFWQQALNDGVVVGTELEPIQVTLQASAGGSKIADGAARFAAGAAPSSMLHAPSSTLSQQAQGLELIFRPDPSVWDGRFANNGWLQELPRPLTAITWDNAALISPQTAAEQGLQNEDMVELALAGRTMRAPVWIMPGHPDGAVSIHLGYGRSRGGQVGAGAGFNAYELRAGETLSFAAGLQLRKTGDRYRIATTQEHFSMEGRELVRVGTLEEFRSDPRFARTEFDDHLPSFETKQAGEAAAGEGVPSLHREFAYDGYAWGMSIDTNACIGCNACTTACQAENNIPVVGKEQVLVSREMHWLKVDQYYEGGIDNPHTYFQPRPCMHCEKAPCEVVCPVAATAHDDEGLNQMVYNRCVGTRYCSNNCPYKVRRFNFLEYTRDVPVINLARNPDVTVRNRGVMEKCTYCVQRIEGARIEAKRAGRPIADGEVRTACQQVCPTDAIVFGNINDPNSQVTMLKSQPLNYGMLNELGTQPRTTYLARLRNPNPELPEE